MAIVVGDRRYDRRATNQQRKDKSSGSKGKMFSLRLKVPEEPIRVHFQKPAEPYPDPAEPNVRYHWKKGATHYVASVRKYIECDYDKCLTCAYVNPERFGFKDVKKVGFLDKCYARSYYALCGWVEEWHVLVDQEKKNADGDSKTYKVRILEREYKRDAKKSSKHSSRTQSQDKVERVFGRHIYLDVSGAAWRIEFDAALEEIERHTRDGGYLYPRYYGCAHCSAPFEQITEQCGSCGSESVGVDPEKYRAFCGDCDAEWELLEHRSKDLRALTDTLYECDSCKEQGYPVPFMVKLNVETGEVEEQPEGGWDVMELFDAQFTLVNEKSADDGPSKMIIDSWCFKEPDPRLFNPEFQGSGKDAEAVAKRNGEPIDLSFVHSPDSSAAQAAKLGLEDLFRVKAESRSQKVVSYKRGKPGIPVDEEPEVEEEETEGADE